MHSNSNSLYIIDIRVMYMLPSPVTFAPKPNHSPSASRDASPKGAPQPAQFQSLTNASFANPCAFMQIQMPGGCRPPDTGAGSTWSPRNKLLPKAGIAPVRRIIEVRQAAESSPPGTPRARAYLLRVF